LLAIDPGGAWEPGARVPAVPLLLYDDVTIENGATLDGYHHADEWSGGAWLTAGDKAAVVFAGTKGQGECWYGFSNGLAWPENPPYPPVPEGPHDLRGWWSSSFQAQILFYDPAELADVAAGRMPARAPQPYAVLDVEPYLYSEGPAWRNERLGAASFDRGRGLLYLFELYADEARPLVHVWQIEP
jgi:hypothetical protein